MLALASLKRWLPWALALGIILAMFSRVPIEEALAAARQARLEIFAALVLTSVGLWFLIESAAFRYLFSRFNASTSWREACSLRGASYLLAPIHLSVGKAAVVVRLRTMKNVPLLAGTSSMLLYQTIDGVVLAGLAIVGLALIPSTPDLVGLWIAAITTLVVSLAYLALIRADWPRMAVLDRLRRLALHRSHRAMRGRDFAVLVTAKLAYHLVFAVALWLGLRSFGVVVPLSTSIATSPVIEAIGGLPITPAGLGTQQSAMLYFFGNIGFFGGAGSSGGAAAFDGVARVPAVVAFGFSFPIAIIVARCALGLVYLPEIMRARPATSPEESGACVIPDAPAPSTPGTAHAPPPVPPYSPAGTS
jgi:uncharacterized membrane protein YbhN (UPF0104 family)